jgi:uncharacterized delta-60 repeat protein
MLELGYDMKKTRLTVAVIFALASMLRLNAQPGSLDITFNPGSSLGTVLCTALQTNGQIVIGGYFTAINGSNRHGVARLNADGSLDFSFDPGVGPNSGSGVMGLAVQPDGKILICGSFSELNNLNCAGFARLRSDGSVDTGFTNLAHGVSALALQPDNKILVAAEFSHHMKTFHKKSAQVKSKKDKARPTELEKYLATKSEAQIMAMLRRGKPEKYGDCVVIHVDKK